MSGKFSIHYKVHFVSGILEGIKTELSLTYPMSSFERIKKDMESDIKSRRVIDPSPNGSSMFYITDYRIEFDEV